MALSAAQWRRFYSAERAALGASGLEALIRSAPEVALPKGGAVLFPHTRLSASGRLPAAAARAIVRSGTPVVLAIGVLHGARERDADRVRRARAGDASARAELRRVHGTGGSHDHGHAAEEFSLDGFCALVESAAKIHDCPRPEIICRYPLLVEDEPGTLPGIDELERLVLDGAQIVATGDLVHHGVGYGTPRDLALPATEATRTVARTWVEQQLEALGTANHRRFGDLALAQRSDLRDAGPVLVHLLGGRARFSVRAFELTGYADVLGAEEPTWVASTLATVAPIL